MVGIGGGKQVRIERWMSVGVGVFVVLVCVGGGGERGRGGYINPSIEVYDRSIYISI